MPWVIWLHLNSCCQEKCPFSQSLPPSAGQFILFHTSCAPITVLLCLTIFLFFTLQFWSQWTGVFICDRLFNLPSFLHLFILIVLWTVDSCILRGDWNGCHFSRRMWVHEEPFRTISSTLPTSQSPPSHLVTSGSHRPLCLSCVHFVPSIPLSSSRLKCGKICVCVCVSLSCAGHRDRVVVLSLSTCCHLL